MRSARRVKATRRGPGGRKLQVVVGAAILAGGPSETIDAYGTLVISGIILLGAVFLLYEVGLQGREWLSDQRGDSRSN